MSTADQASMNLTAEIILPEGRLGVHASSLALLAGPAPLTGGLMERSGNAQNRAHARSG